MTIVVNCERTVTCRGFRRGKGAPVPSESAKLACGRWRLERVSEVAIHKDQINLQGQKQAPARVALWHSGLPVDVLPAEGFLDVLLGEEKFRLATGR